MLERRQNQLDLPGFGSGCWLRCTQQHMLSAACSNITSRHHEPSMPHRSNSTAFTSSLWLSSSADKAFCLFCPIFSKSACSKPSHVSKFFKLVVRIILHSSPVKRLLPCRNNVAHSAKRRLALPTYCASVRVLQSSCAVLPPARIAACGITDHPSPQARLLWEVCGKGSLSGSYLPSAYCRS